MSAPGIVSLEFTLKCFNRILATHLEFWFLLSNTLGQEGASSNPYPQTLTLTSTRNLPVLLPSGLFELLIATGFGVDRCFRASPFSRISYLLNCSFVFVSFAQHPPYANIDITCQKISLIDIS
ncbi:hypothetical protein RJT34_25454 [Clitoria ternatea]|uniref:Uncharacterized protein n=1 Tax=Clitoria ternatea TaxID=43366 RepID=A0AAN9IK08_CLITE